MNKECNEVHRLIDCPKTSDEKRKELLDAYYNSKKSAKSVRNTESEPIKTEHADATKRRYRVLLADKVETIALGDSGSDFNAITVQNIRNLLNCATHLIPRKFKHPISLSTAVSDPSINFTSSQSIVISITIVLPGSEMPVRLRGVSFIVVNQHMDEILLGRPFL